MKQYFPAMLFAPLVATLIFSSSVARASAAAPASAPSQEYRQWIVDMKKAERGPFSRLRWFCTDGRVTPPKPYVCGEEGGHQHGEWSEQTKELRGKGYKIANLLAGADGKELIAQPGFVELYNQMLVEKYLVAADDGWILRRAMFYRGAIQQEDEAEGGRNLLVAMIAKPEWIGTRFPAMRIGVRLLPHGKETASVQKVRQLSASLSDQDEGFKSLRGKIHGTPDAGDAQRVRDYAAKVSDPDMKAKYLELAEEIDEVYQSGVPARIARVQCQTLFRRALVAEAAAGCSQCVYAMMRPPATTTRSRLHCWPNCVTPCRRSRAPRPGSA